MKRLAISTLLLASVPPLTAAELMRLAAGDRTEHTLAVRARAVFELDLAAYQQALVRVEQRGIDVQLRLLRGEQVVTERDGLNGAWGTETMVMEAAPALRLEVAASSNEGGQACFVLELIGLESGSPEAKSWRRADQAMKSALDGYHQRSLDTLPQVIEDFRRAEEIWRHLEETELRAEALYGLGSAYHRSGLSTKALLAFTSAGKLFESVELPHGTARSWNRLGQTQKSRGQTEAAIRSYGLSLAIWRRVGNTAQQGKVLNNLGVGYQNAGELRRALEHYEQALDLMGSPPDQRRVAKALNNIGAVHANLGEPDQAHAMYRRALEIAKTHQYLPLEADILVNLGYLHRIMGEMQKALHSYQDALQIRQRIKDPRGMATTLNNLGVLFQELGQAENADKTFRESLTLRRQSGDQDGQTVTMTRLADLWMSQGQPRAAQDILLQAMQIQSPHYPDSEAFTRSTLGAVYAELGQTEPAMEQLNAALLLARDPKKPNPRRELATRWRIAKVEMRQGEFDAAHLTYLDCLELSRHLASASGEVRALQGLGRVDMARGHLDSARAYLEQALELIEKRRTKVVEPVLRAQFYGRQQDTHELYLDLLLRLANQRGDPTFEYRALEANERARARGLIELLTEADNAVLGQADPELAARRQSLARRLNAKASRAATLNPSDQAQGREWAVLQQEIDSLIEDKNLVEVEMRRGDSHYLEFLQPPVVNARKIQRTLLDENTLLLEYALGGEHSYLWVMGRESLDTFRLPPREVIEKAVGRAADELSHHRTGIRLRHCPALASLGQMLLSPLVRLLGERRLVIVPDGALHGLPFAALPDPRDTRPACNTSALVERHEIRRWPSAAAVAEQRSRLAGRAPAPKLLALIADPVFRADDPRISAAIQRLPGGNPAAGFDRLPWSRREAEAISKVASDLIDPDGQSVFQGQGVFQALDFEARRDVVTGLNDYRLIHFATHGIVDDEHPELSGLVLSLVDEKGQPSDGFLRLHDLYDLRLRADLVVLSGCRTALGQEIRGEGLVGLTHGFFYAGATRVLASLWQVDDRATAELMRLFYQELLGRGASAAAALRAAQREMRRQGPWRDPYFWAGFVLQGE